jgi:riboflavin kinase / FMN adenylyltransferase
MKVHYGFENIENIKNPVVTTGSFDGVHVGHRVILNRLNTLASENDGESVLITFHPHPRKVLFPEKAKDIFLINSQREKKYLLETVGINHVIIVEFTKEFAKITSSEFVQDYLLGKLKAHTIIVGFNHHFGHNREGDYKYLYDLSKKQNFSVEEIPMQDIENEAVSSTRIRKAINQGHIGRANAYLDHPYFIIGQTKPLHKNYSKNSFESLEILIEEDIKMLPPNGRYAAKTIVNNESNNVMCELIDNKVLIHSISNIRLPVNELVYLEMHKTIRLFNETDNNNTFDFDKNDVKELIY